MNDYPVFTSEMKETHTILVPDMLPVHFKFILSVFRHKGYKFELLKNNTQDVVNEGLKNVHNDVCYPALLVIGQFMDALKSGKYNPDTTALMLAQTGGGCRFSSYISLLRKALKHQFPQVPVISINLSGLEKDSCFEVNAWMFSQIINAVFLADLIMLLYNQCKPYEALKNKTDEIRSKWQEKLEKDFENNAWFSVSTVYKKMLVDFSSIEKNNSKKIKVGIIGELYVKHSPLANNYLEEFLISNGYEPVISPLYNFILHCARANVSDGELFGFRNKVTLLSSLGYNYLYAKQKKLIGLIKKQGIFEPPHDFILFEKAADRFINQGVVMGEGWLLTSEMAVFAVQGIPNIICVQPFGCLPNHIIAKGMIRAVKKAYPNANITAIDYDPGASRVNQENRIKLMLANVKH